MFEFCVLASGSRANCIYVGTPSTRVLIDCGLSAREAAKRLTSIDIDPDSIDAIVVSHEHSDHITGVRVFSKRHQTRVLANPLTITHSRELSAIPSTEVQQIQTGQHFTIGELEFESFSVVHDAADPIAFKVSFNQYTLGIITDLGQLTTLVREKSKNLDALVLESNHDSQLLLEAPYPWELKQRISSRTGHLSNDTAGELVKELSQQADNRLQVIVAAHISENSNYPELALESFERNWQHTIHPSYIAAGPGCATERFKIKG